MHPISRPGFCGPRSCVDGRTRSGPRRPTTIWGTWPPDASPPFGITHLTGGSTVARTVADRQGEVDRAAVAQRGELHRVTRVVQLEHAAERLAVVQADAVDLL